MELQSLNSDLFVGMCLVHSFLLDLLHVVMRFVHSFFFYNFLVGLLHVMCLHFEWEVSQMVKISTPLYIGQKNSLMFQSLISFSNGFVFLLLPVQCHCFY